MRIKMKPPKPAVIGFAGPIGSGKTAISIALAKSLGWPRASFGDYVRSASMALGHQPSREDLQAAGDRLIKGGVAEFCRRVLAVIDWEVGQPAIVDGIRHVEILNELSSIVSPLPVVLVYVTIDSAIQSARLREREGVGPERIRQIEQHPTEVQLPALRMKASLEVGGDSPLDASTMKIVQYLSQSSV